MKKSKRRLTALFATCAVMIGACSSEPEVSFRSDIKPIADQYCSECHEAGGEGAKESGFLTDSYESIMKGTKYGPVIVPGDALSSSLYRLVSGEVDSSIRMPHGKEALKQEEIVKIELWIQQGAKNN